jgi:hypothetical protein
MTDEGPQLGGCHPDAVELVPGDEPVLASSELREGAE